MFRFAFVSLAQLLVVAPQLTLAQNVDSSITPQTLSVWLHDRVLNDAELATLLTQPFASDSLTKEEADQATQEIWSARRNFLRQDRKAEMDAREIVLGDLKMPFWYEVFGKEPATGRSVFIAMHGGGNVATEGNDEQYEALKRMYQPAEGIYLVPRATSNGWDLWHQSHIDWFFDRLIADLIVFEHANPNRVYILGYSAGGDGVYQLAPRMADRFAAAAMMAGHPNDARPEGLRNIGFTVHVGALDDAYDRNTAAATWGKALDALQAADPGAYVHQVTLHEGLGHWMNREEAVAVPWMATFTRNPWPRKVVWVQDDVRHSRFYWLSVDQEHVKAGDEIVANVSGNVVRIEKCAATRLTLLLNDTLLNLDESVQVILADGVSSEYKAVRTIATVARSFQGRHDLFGAATATVRIDCP